MADFQRRERRYGGLSESVGHVEENPSAFGSWPIDYLGSFS